jgi:ribosomal protein S18 acetylase RimI-like enzyme
MRIKPVESIDELSGALQIHNLGWKEAYQDILPEDVIEDIPSEPPEDHVEERFESLGGNKEEFLVAIGDDGTTRGYIYVLWGSDTKEFVGENEAGLKEIYVHPDWWGQGIGTRLLNEGLDVLPSSIEAIRLEMLSGNEDAREFYLARDFEIDGQSEFEIAGEPYPTEIYVRSL